MIDEITLWHERARPKATQKDLDVQIGCHLEEFEEMLDAIETSYLYINQLKYYLTQMSTMLKEGELSVSFKNRENFLDSLADQIVTAVGAGVCAGMDMKAAVKEVNASNWSKFNYKGYPEFDQNGKIAKGAAYKKPNLEGMY